MCGVSRTEYSTVPMILGPLEETLELFRNSGNGRQVWKVVSFDVQKGCCVDAMAEPQHFNLFRSRDLGSSSGAGHEAVSPLAKDG